MKETAIDQLLEIAAIISRQKTGTISTAEQQRLDQWITLSTANRELYEELLQAQPEIKTNTGLQASAGRVYEAIGFTQPQTVGINRWWWAAAAAAAVVTGIVSITLFQQPKTNVLIAQDIQPGGNKATLTLANGDVITLDSAAIGILAKQGNVQITKLANGELSYNTTGNNNNTSQYNTMATPRGGQYKLILPDGTQVWLNAASSITYPTAFANDDRTVSITGEAYFEVAKDEKKPFHVKVNDQQIDVLGTSFNVMAYNDETAISTTLLEGTVKVNGTLLKPGQQSQLSKTGVLTVRQTEAAEAIAWKNGFFEFNHEQLASIVRKLSRWYDADITYTSTISNKTFTGQLPRNASITTVLKMLEITQGIHFEIKDKTVTIMP